MSSRVKLEINECGAQQGDIWEYCDPNLPGQKKIIFLIRMVNGGPAYDVWNLTTGKFEGSGGSMPRLDNWKLISRVDPDAT